MFSDTDLDLKSCILMLEGKKPESNTDYSLESTFKLQAITQQPEQQVKEQHEQLQEKTVALEQSLALEGILKRITERVRSTLDESSILKTTVKELAQVLHLHCCDTGIYNTELTTSSITYEYTSKIRSALGRVMQMQDYSDIYIQLVEGQPLQFCLLKSTSTRNKARRYAILSCPIKDHDGVLGDLWLFKDKAETFSNQEINLVRQVATQCAIALRQSRLYQAAKSRIQELEQFNGFKDDFLNTVSHELRTPITNMKMAITMLASADVPAKASRYLNILQQECTREFELINNLLDFQNMDMLKAGTDFQDWVDVKSCVQCRGESFNLRTRERSQTLSIKIPDGIPPLLTNSKAFNRIILELTNHACKYTPIGGLIQVRAFDDGKVLTIIIRNQTVIPQSDIPHIFDESYRIPNATPWKQGDTGLGLPLIKQLLEQIKGTIEVDSDNISNWTTVTLKFCRS